VPSVVVLGGGLAGLACAWKLRRAGHEVEVLERRTAEPELEAALASGAGWPRQGDRDLLAAASALGLGLRPLPAAGDGFAHAGRFEALPTVTASTLLRTPGGSRRRRLAWARSARRALGAAAVRPAALAAQDGASFAAVLAGTLGDDPLVPRLAALAGLACGEAPAQLSYPVGLAALAADGPAVALDGGLPALRRALAAGLTVRHGCQAVDVETGGSGARVRYRTQGRPRSVLADAVVAALPAPELLACCAKLTPEERGFFEAVGSAPQLSVRLQLERPPAALPWLRLGFPDRDATLRSVVAAHRVPGVAPAGGGLLVARLAEAPSRRLADAPDADVLEAALAALAPTPLGRPPVRGLAVDRGARSLFTPGFVTRLARFERRIERSQRLAFAGAASVGPGPGAAFTSGVRAATEIARSL